MFGKLSLWEIKFGPCSRVSIHSTLKMLTQPVVAENAQQPGSARNCVIPCLQRQCENRRDGPHAKPRACTTIKVLVVYALASFCRCCRPCRLCRPCRCRCLRCCSQRVLQVLSTLLLHQPANTQDSFALSAKDQYLPRYLGR